MIGILNILGITDYREEKDEFVTCCIFCGEKKYNFQINFVKKVYHCWVCNDGGSITWLIRKVTGLLPEEANRLFRLDEIDVEKTLETINDNLKVGKQRYGYLTFTDNDDRFGHWGMRGINMETVSLLRLGYDKYTRRITIPIFDEAKVCVGIVRRAVHKDQEPKYLYTSGFERNKVVQDLTRPYTTGVVLVEGHIDAIKLCQLGYNPICIMGTDLSDYAFGYVRENFERVFLMMDNDYAGQVATKKIAQLFFESGMEVYEVEYITNDPGDMISKEQILNSRRYNLSDF